MARSGLRSCISVLEGRSSDTFSPTSSGQLWQKMYKGEHGNTASLPILGQKSCSAFGKVFRFIFDNFQQPISLEYM